MSSLKYVEIFQNHEKWLPLPYNIMNLIYIIALALHIIPAKHIAFHSYQHQNLQRIIGNQIGDVFQI